MQLLCNKREWPKRKDLTVSGAQEIVLCKQILNYQFNNIILSPMATTSFIDFMKWH
jgi:hypothetical protein